MAFHGNLNSKSDLEVGARLLEVGIWGAYRNVVINLPDIEDEAYKAKVIEEAEALVARAQASVDVVLERLDARD